MGGFQATAGSKLAGAPSQWPVPLMHAGSSTPMTSVHTHHCRVCTLTTVRSVHSSLSGVHTHHCRECTLTNVRAAHSHQVCTLTVGSVHSPLSAVHTHRCQVCTLTVSQV